MPPGTWRRSNPERAAPSRRLSPRCRRATTSSSSSAPYAPDIASTLGGLARSPGTTTPTATTPVSRPAGLGIFGYTGGAAPNLEPIPIDQIFADYGPFGTANNQVFRRCPGGATQPIDRLQPVRRPALPRARRRRSRDARRLRRDRRAARTMRRILAIAAGLLADGPPDRPPGGHRRRQRRHLRGARHLRQRRLHRQGRGGAGGRARPSGTVESVDVSGDDEIVSLEGGGHPEPGKAVVVLNIEDRASRTSARTPAASSGPQSLIGERYVDCTPTQPRAPGEPAPPELERDPRRRAWRRRAPAAAREQRHHRRPRPGPEHPARFLPRPLPPDHQRPRRGPRRARR